MRAPASGLIWRLGRAFAVLLLATACVAGGKTVRGQQQLGGNAGNQQGNQQGQGSNNGSFVPYASVYSDFYQYALTSDRHDLAQALRVADRDAEDRAPLAHRGVRRHRAAG